MPDDPDILEIEDAKPSFDSPAVQTTLPDGSVKRGRGRPKGSRNRPKFDEEGNPLPTGRLGIAAIHYANKRDALEVSNRLQSIMVGGTGIASVVRPHLQMRPDEAKDIADPLTSYLLRQEQYSPRIREFLDKYDIVAAGLAFMTYLVRVWVDDGKYRKEHGSANTRSETVVDSTARPSEPEFRESSNEGNDERTQTYGGVSGISTPIPPRG